MSAGKRNRWMAEDTTGRALLFRRWTGLCLRLGLDGASEWESIRDHYDKPQRAYHNLTHIADCLRQLDQCVEAVQDPDALEMAIWFHDVIYDPRSSENELKSAEMAESFLSATTLGPTVRELILATRHQHEPREGDAALIVDIDLSILGSVSSEYRRYASAIRAEYSFVPDDQYAAGRTKILSNFLKRPHLFSLPSFRDTLESTARTNLQAEIDSLAESVRD